MPPTSAASLDEPRARAVWALRAVERDGAGLWREDDAEQATREALAGLPATASDAEFLARRATMALPRLQARLPGLAEWLEAPGWMAAGAAAVLLAAFLLGAAIDHLGGGQRINLLAPPVWAVVLWNLAVYALLLVGVWRPPLAASAWRTLAARWLAARPNPPASTPAATMLLARVVADDAQLTAPLTLARLARLMHACAALLALGLIAGLYLRGLALDYRAGWQSTFLDATQVQALLNLLLAPAAAVTGIAVPAIAALQVAPDQAPSGPAAPWLHLYAATLLLAVVLPRALLAIFAALRCRWLTTHLLTPLHDPALAALAATARAQPLRLGLWPGPVPRERLARLLASPAPPGIAWMGLGDGDLAAAVAVGREPLLQRLGAAWARWRDPAQQQRHDEPHARWRGLDALIVSSAPEALPPALAPLLQSLQRPLLPLTEVQLATAEACWVNEAGLWQALAATIPPPRRAVVERLAAAALQQHEARLRQAVQLLAEHHAAVIALQLDVPADADAGQRLRVATEPLLQRLAIDLHTLHGLDAVLAAEPALPVTEPALPLAEARGVQLRRHVSEGKAAVLGGALTGALTGLKADLASGGLTMGGGLLAGGLIGALGAAGAARGANKLRGTRHDLARWDTAALKPLLHAALMHYLLAAHHGQAPVDPLRWQEALDHALQADALPWQLWWTPPAGAPAVTAAALHEPIEQLLRRALQQLHGNSGASTRDAQSTP